MSDDHADSGGLADAVEEGIYHYLNTIVSFTTEMVRIDLDFLDDNGKVYLETTADIDGERTDLMFAVNTCGSDFGYDQPGEQIRAGFEICIGGQCYDGHDCHVSSLAANIYTDERGVVQWRMDDNFDYGPLSLKVSWDRALALRSKCGHLPVTFTVEIQANNLKGFLEDNRELINDVGSSRVRYPKQPAPKCLSCPSLLAQLSTETPLANYMHLFTKTPFEDDGLPKLFFINVGEKTLKVHPGVLISRSPALKALVLDSENFETVISDVEPDEMKAFVDILYDPQKLLDFRGDLDALMSLYRTANKYGVSDLCRLCERGILSIDISPERLLDILNLADKYNYESPDFRKSVSYSISKGLPTDVVYSILKLAKELGVPEIPDVCAKALESTVTEDNVFELLLVAQQNNLMGLLNHCAEAMDDFPEGSDSKIDDFFEKNPDTAIALLRERRRACRKRKLENAEQEDEG